MIKAAVLGSPISHSLSPKIHSHAYGLLGLKSSYSAIEVNENSFSDFYLDATSKESDKDWSGFSLTMPLKEIALQFCEDVDSVTESINSGNTLYKSDGTWKVTSTDYLAFRNLLEVSKESKVAIIGGGGTARAAIGALNSKVKEVDVFLRSDSRMSALSKAAPELLIHKRDLAHPLDGYDLIIQTTPADSFDDNALNIKSASGVLLEAIYKPWPTQLVKHFEELGGRVISGKELLVEQALFQIEIFSGVKFDVTDMRSALLSLIASD
jgi:shikimate dehydrogenase